MRDPIIENKTLKSYCALKGCNFSMDSDYIKGAPSIFVPEGSHSCSPTEVKAVFPLKYTPLLLNGGMGNTDLPDFFSDKA